MSIKDNLTEWFTGTMAVATMVGLGFYIGNYSASSENAAIKRDLDFATNARGAAEVMSNLERISNASNNVFRFEQHALEISVLDAQVSSLSSDLQAAEQRVLQKQGQLDEVRVRLNEARAQVDELRSEVTKRFSIDEEFSLAGQTSRTFFEQRQTVGLAGIYPSFATVISPIGREDLSTGEMAVWRTPHTTCTLTLTSITYEIKEANLLLVCT